jgi:septum formation protein
MEARSPARQVIRLILASGSPRRAEILRNAGFEFEVRPAHVDETRLAGEGAEQYVRRLAEAKARFVAERMTHENGAAILIGADTVVILEGQILGKPMSAEDARRMLRLLSGKTHQVLTGVSLILASDGASPKTHVETTRVSFVDLSVSADPGGVRSTDRTPVRPHETDGCNKA